MTEQIAVSDVVPTAACKGWVEDPSSPGLCINCGDTVEAHRLASTDRTPAQMREDALLWARAGYPVVAVHRYRDAADQVDRLTTALEQARKGLRVWACICGRRKEPDPEKHGELCTYRAICHGRI